MPCLPWGCTQGVDTIQHRALYCAEVPTNEALKGFQWVKHIAAGYSGGRFAQYWDQWLTTGLRHPPVLRGPRTDSEAIWEGELNFQGQLVCFLDGSTFNGKWKEIARAGWGCVFVQKLPVGATTAHWVWAFARQQPV